MKKSILMLALVAFFFTMNAQAQDEATAKSGKAKTEKSCSKNEKKECAKKAECKAKSEAKEKKAEGRKEE